MQKKILDKILVLEDKIKSLKLMDDVSEKCFEIIKGYHTKSFKIEDAYIATFNLMMINDNDDNFKKELSLLVDDIKIFLEQNKTDRIDWNTFYKLNY